MIMAGCDDGGGGDTITIMFDTDGGSAVASVEIDKGGSLPADYFTGSKIPAKSGYRFDGWKNGAVPVDAATAFDANTTLTAQWIRQVTVSFSLGDGVAGTPPAAVIIDAGTALGSKYPAQTPQRSGGWEFTGWFNSGTQYTSGTVITTTAATFVLTAGWREEEEYVVTYAQAPDIHPGSDLKEKYPPPSEGPDAGANYGVLKVVVDEEFTIELTAANVEKGAGVLSAQWYRSTEPLYPLPGNNWVGDAVGAVQNAAPSNPHELTPRFEGSEPEVGEFWYWVVVTNYNEKATITQIRTKRTQYQLKVIVTDDE